MGRMPTLLGMCYPRPGQGSLSAHSQLPPLPMGQAWDLVALGALQGLFRCEEVPVVTAESQAGSEAPEGRGNSLGMH